jgi:DNA invertase Pin-like site-specific DNA recombinase
MADTKITKIIGEVRVSTDGQAKDDRQGLPRQRAGIATIFAAHGLPSPTAADIVEIKGVSGSDVADSPQWRTEILPKLADGYALAIDDLSRLIRADGFDLRVLRDCKAHETQILLPGGKSYDTGDPRDVMTLTIFAGIGGYDKAEIRRRLHGAKLRAAKGGTWIGGTLPMGITFLATDVREPKKSRAWGYDADADKVRDAFTAVAAGTSLKRAAAILGFSGSAHVARVLASTIYKGIAPVSDGRRVFGPGCPLGQLVDDATWQIVHDKILANRARNRALRDRAPTADGWASGFLYSAGETDRHVSTLRTVGDGARYRCRCTRGGRNFDHLCGLSLRAGIVAPTLDAALAAMSRDVLAAEAVRQAVAAEADAGARKAKARATADRKIKGCDARREALVRRLATTDDTAAADALSDALAMIKRDRDAAAADLAAADAIPDADPRAADAMLAAWAFNPGATPDAKREWLARYSVRLHVDRDGLQGVTLCVPGGPSVALACGCPWGGTYRFASSLSITVGKRAA